MKFELDRTRLTTREGALLRRLEREYTPEVVRSVLVPLITQTSPVSLRALDWAVVNWSKQHNVVCMSQTPGQMTNIHHSYRAALGYWKRRLFDPFRRRERVFLNIDGVRHETTLGQANFALWTYHTGVLTYVMSNVHAIEEDMNRVSQRQKRVQREMRQSGQKRKRQELTNGPVNLCVAYRAPVRVTFT